MVLAAAAVFLLLLIYSDLAVGLALVAAVAVLPFEWLVFAWWRRPA